jgi:hypothetical protein
VAHPWERWFELLSGERAVQYAAVVTLIRGDGYFYSCGMHHFGLPECEAPASLPVGEAAHLMNQFNAWQIAEHPKLNPGETFSLAESAPHYRLSRHADTRHKPDDLFHNPHGVWRLDVC